MIILEPLLTIFVIWGVIFFLTTLVVATLEGEGIPKAVISLACIPKYKWWVNTLMKPFLFMWIICAAIPSRLGRYLGYRLNRLITTTDGCK